VYFLDFQLFACKGHAFYSSNQENTPSAGGGGKGSPSSLGKKSNQENALLFTAP